jgi:HSP20 family protein
MARKRDQLDRLQDEIQELIDELWQVPRFSGLRRGFRPQIDVVRNDDPPEFRVVVELAGIDPNDVTLRLADGALLIAGVRRRPSPSGRMSFQLMEIDYGPFQRRIPLSEPVDAAGARATYERGLLTIVFPVAARAPVPAKVSIPVKGRP